MKKILSVFSTMPVGGAEIFWLNILKEIDRSRFEPITCCIAGKGTVGEQAENMGNEVISLGLMKNRRFDIGVARAVSRIVHERNIDILHLHMYHAGLYGRLAAMLYCKTRPKCVLHVHNIYTNLKLHRKLINRFLMHYTDRVIAVSEPVREDVIRYDCADPGKVVVLNTCIDHKRHAITLSKKEARSRIGLSESDFVLGTVSRLVEAKGHVYMLKTLSMLKSAGYDFKLVVVGKGELEDKLRNDAVSLGVGNNTVFLGERHDIPELYRAMDMYLSSSIWEGAPLTLADAMVAGLPCVVTPAGGMPDMVDQGRCGVIVPAKDPEKMAEAVIELYNSKEKMKDLSVKSHERSRRFYSCDIVTRELENLYDNL